MSSGKPICLTAAAKTPNMHTYRNAKASYFQINSKENIDFFRVLHLTALHCIAIVPYKIVMKNNV